MKNKIEYVMGPTYEDEKLMYERAKRFFRDVDEPLEFQKLELLVDAFRQMYILGEIKTRRTKR